MSKINDLKNKMVSLVEQLRVQLSETPTPEAAAEEVVIEMKESTLTDGTIVKYDKLEVGAAMMVISEAGEVPAPDATHQFEDGTLVTTKDGLITEIVEAAPMAEESEMFAELKSQIETLKTENESLKTQFSEIQAENKTKFSEILKVVEGVAQVVALASDEPAAQPAAKPTSIVSAIKQFKINK